MAVLSVFNVSAQSTIVNQVIIGSGGDFSNPDDFVTIASYNPLTEVTTVFDIIKTQSIQDIVVADGKAYVSAQDSIVAYNLDNYSRIASVYAGGVNKLNVAHGKLVASFWYPETSGFVKTYNLSDLSQDFVFNDVSDEAAGSMEMPGNMVVVAVPGGWASTEGKLAWIDVEDNELVAEASMSGYGKGVNYFIEYNIGFPNYAAVTVTPWGDSTFSIYGFDATGSNIGNYQFDAVMNGYTGLMDNFLYGKINGGIGKVNLETMELDQNLVIEPGALSMAGTALDTINNLIFAAYTDYFSMGEGKIYNLNSEVVGSFDANISPEAIAIDYRDNTSVEENTKEQVSIYPNPANDFINVSTDMINASNIVIYDITGKEVFKTSISRDKNVINVSSLKKGMYFLSVSNNQKLSSATLIIN